MSRSSKIVERPFEKTLSFKNEKFNKKTKEVEREAGFYYWEKFDNPEEGQPKGQNVKVDMPIKFIWLESAQSISGFNKKANTGVYSNEVLTDPRNRLVKKYGIQDLVVKVSQDKIIKGKWEDIKEKVKDAGGKFCIPVYALMKTGEEWGIVRFLFSGGSRAAWFNISSNKDKLKDNFIVIDGVEEVEMSTGETYQKPVIKFAEKIPASLEDLINEGTDKVDSYFEFLLQSKPEEEQEIPDPEMEEYSTSDY